MTMELESKFCVNAPGTFDDILNLKKILDYILDIKPGKLQKDIYFDTEDFLLLKKKTSLRVREKESSLTVTFKAPKRFENNTFLRKEVEEEIGINDRETFINGNNDPVVEARKLIGKESLVPVLAVENYRQIINLTKKGMIHFELSLDKVIFKHGGAEQEFMELEIETKGGDEVSLHKISLFLKQKYRLTSSKLSKYERGISSFKQIL